MKMQWTPMIVATIAPFSTASARQAGRVGSKNMQHATKPAVHRQLNHTFKAHPNPAARILACA
eukprot:7413894-Alexandrium_andersonii.AAC.1